MRRAKLNLDDEGSEDARKVAADKATLLLLLGVVGVVVVVVVVMGLRGS